MQNYHHYRNPNQISQPMPMPVDLMLDPLRKYPDIYPDPIMVRHNFSTLQPNQDTISNSSRVSQLSADMQRNIEEDFAKNHKCCNHRKRPRSSKRVSFKNQHDTCIHDANYFDTCRRSNGNYFDPDVVRRDLDGLASNNRLGVIDERNEEYCPHGKQMHGGIYQRKVHCIQDEFDRKTTACDGCANLIKENWYKKYSSELPRNKYGCEHLPSKTNNTSQPRSSTCNQMHNGTDNYSGLDEPQTSKTFRHSDFHQTRKKCDVHFPPSKTATQLQSEMHFMYNNNGVDVNICNNSTPNSNINPFRQGAETKSENQETTNTHSAIMTDLQTCSSTKSQAKIEPWYDKKKNQDTNPVSDTCKIISNYLEPSKTAVPKCKRSLRRNLSGGTDWADQVSDTDLKKGHAATLKALQDVSDKIKKLTQRTDWSPKKQSPKPHDDGNKYNIVVLKKVSGDKLKGKPKNYSSWYNKPMRYSGHRKKYTDRAQGAQSSPIWRVDSSRLRSYPGCSGGGQIREFGTQYEPSFETCINKERLMNVVEPLRSDEFKNNYNRSWELKQPIIYPMMPSWNTPYRQYYAYNFGGGLNQNFSSVYTNRGTNFAQTSYVPYDGYCTNFGTVLRKPTGYFVYSNCNQDTPSCKHTCKTSHKKHEPPDMSEASCQAISSTSVPCCKPKSDPKTNYLSRQPPGASLRGSMRYWKNPPQLKRPYDKSAVKKNLTNKVAYHRSIVKPCCKRQDYNRPAVPHLRHGDRGNHRQTSAGPYRRPYYDRDDLLELHMK